MNQTRFISTSQHAIPFSPRSDLPEMIDSELFTDLLDTDVLLTDESLQEALHELYIHFPTELLRTILARPNFFPDKRPYLLQFSTHQQWVKQLTETILLNTKRLESFKQVLSPTNRGCTWRSVESQENFVRLIAEQLAESFGRTHDVQFFFDKHPLHIHPHHLKLLIQELVRNALQHSKPGDEIRIETFDMGSQQLLSVYDAGEGMKEEHIHRLKNDMIHVSHLMYGLGYVFIKRIVQQYKGGLEVVSVPQVETQVYLTFPAPH